ncbi:hypothetical protein S83_064535, partial [Arachis hypogaea]
FHTHNRVNGLSSSALPSWCFLASGSVAQGSESELALLRVAKVTGGALNKPSKILIAYAFKQGCEAVHCSSVDSDFSEAEGYLEEAAFREAIVKGQSP